MNGTCRRGGYHVARKLRCLNGSDQKLYPGRLAGGTTSYLVPPHTRQGFALPPSPRRGFCPSSVRAYGPATFPGGEGFLRRGLPNPYFSISMHC